MSKIVFPQARGAQINDKIYGLQDGGNLKN